MTELDKTLPIIMEKYEGLKNIPWVKLATLPTPIKELTGLEKELDFNSIYVKQDNLTHGVYGGNKCRKFEFVFADAIKKDKTKILTMGGIGTNHGLAQSVLMQDLYKDDMESIVFMFNQPLIDHVRHNLLLEQYYGSKMIYSKGMVGAVFKILWYYITHRKSYFVYPGASKPIGTIGFVNAVYELKKQIDAGLMPEPNYLFVPIGSTGTCAGLLLGCEMLNLKTKIIGVSVSAKAVANDRAVVKLAHNTWKLLKKYDVSIPKADKKDLSKRLSVFYEFFGGEYGLPTEEGKEAIDLIKKTDNVELELTYTGKTFSALLAFIREKKQNIEGKTILFWNTHSSQNHEKEASEVDYHSLPKVLHKFFNGAIPKVDGFVKARSSDEIC